MRSGWRLSKNTTGCEDFERQLFRKNLFLILEPFHDLKDPAL